MRDAKISSIMAYHYLAHLSGKNYSIASQKAILGLLKKFYGISICRRTLNSYLRGFEDAGWISRIRRHKAGPRGGIIFNTTIVIVKRPALKYLSKLAHWFRRVGWKLKGWSFTQVVKPDNSFKGDAGNFLREIGAHVREFP